MELKRVTLEYETETCILEGADAEKWIHACNGAVMMSTIHGSPFPEFPWKIIKIEKLDNENSPVRMVSLSNETKSKRTRRK